MDISPTFPVLLDFANKKIRVVLTGSIDLLTRETQNIFISSFLLKLKRALEAEKILALGVN